MSSMRFRDFIKLAAANKKPENMKKIYSILIAAFITTVAIAQPAGWSYVLPMQVTNNTAVLVTDYQLKLTVNTQTPIGAGQMNAAGDDIRFGKQCSGTTLFNYWIESGINTASTVIWVKIDSLPANGSTQLYMFYGNAAASAGTGIPGVFIGPHSSTDSVSSGGAGGVTNSQRGFRFSPNEDVLVSAFGKMEPNGTTRYVTLFDFATQAVLSQQQVNGPAAQYSYQNIANPLWLTNGTQYVLELYQGASDGYYFGTSSQIGQHLTYYDMRYCNGCTQNTFPTSTLSNYQYGYPDMWYWTKQNIAVAPTITAGSVLAATASSPVTICAGDSIQISVTATGGGAPYTYAWSPAAGLSNASVATPMASPASTATYTVIVTDGCGATVTANATVNVNSAPAVTATVSTDSVCLGDSFIPTGGGALTYNWSGGLSDNVAFTPAFNDTYTVTGTDANGCSASATAFVEVLHLPAVVANASTQNTCAGDSIVLMGSGADTYTWDNGAIDNQNHVPAGSAMYHVTGTDIYGCMNTDSVMITVNPLPSVSMSGPTMACDMDAALTLTGSPAGGTFSGPGVTGNQFDPSAATAGTHTLVYAYTDANGCTGYDSISVTVDLCLTVAGTNAQNFEAMPNPFNDKITITLNETSTVVIYNSLGQVVLNQQVNSGHNEINTGAFNPGIYFLEVTGSTGKNTIRIIKND
jgi:hypothetical protein